MPEAIIWSAAWRMCLFGNAVVMDVPTVPAHRRRERERIADDDSQQAVRRPWAFRAASLTVCVPALVVRPVIRPVAESSDIPFGKSSALNMMGRSPVQAIRKRTGEPGRNTVDVWTLNARLARRRRRQHDGLLRFSCCATGSSIAMTSDAETMGLIHQLTFNLLQSFGLGLRQFGKNKEKAGDAHG